MFLGATTQRKVPHCATLYISNTNQRGAQVFCCHHSAQERPQSSRHCLDKVWVAAHWRACAKVEEGCP